MLVYEPSIAGVSVRLCERRIDLMGKDPVPTEYHAYRTLQRDPIPEDVAYLAAPWSVLLNRGLRFVAPDFDLRGGFTICQHDRYEALIPLLKSLGIVTLFTPAAAKSHGDFTVLPFPHVAVHGVEPTARKDLLYSFIGFDSTSLIGSPLRSTVFSMTHPPNTVVKARPSWHWDRRCNPRRTSAREHEEKSEYQAYLSRSRYSLCPRGYDPSSIRFWESLQAGAIPILLSDSMILPEGIDWDPCIVRVLEEDVTEVPRIIAGISPLKEDRMRANCLAAYERCSG